jgi:hypothetical protein
LRLPGALPQARAVSLGRSCLEGCLELELPRARNLIDMAMTCGLSRRLNTSKASQCSRSTIPNMIAGRWVGTPLPLLVSLSVHAQKRPAPSYQAGRKYQAKRHLNIASGCCDVRPSLFYITAPVDDLGRVYGAFRVLQSPRPSTTS